MSAAFRVRSPVLQACRGGISNDLEEYRTALGSTRVRLDWIEPNTAVQRSACVPVRAVVMSHLPRPLGASSGMRQRVTQHRAQGAHLASDGGRHAKCTRLGGHVQHSITAQLGGFHSSSTGHRPARRGRYHRPRQCPGAVRRRCQRRLRRRPAERVDGGRHPTGLQAGDRHQHGRPHCAVRLPGLGLRQHSARLLYDDQHEGHL
jgi:hypothetical protein